MSLPIDILRLVVDEVGDIPRLFDVAATCRAMRSAAERWIYHSVALCEYHSKDAPPGAYSILFDSTQPLPQIMARLDALEKKSQHTFDMTVVMTGENMFMIASSLSDYIIGLRNLRKLEIITRETSEKLAERFQLSKLLQLSCPLQTCDLRSFSTNLRIGEPLLSFFLKDNPHLHEIGVCVDELPALEGLIAQSAPPVDTLRCIIPNMWTYCHADVYSVASKFVQASQKVASNIRILDICDSAASQGYEIEELETIGEDLIEFNQLTRLHMTMIAFISGTTSLGCFKQLAHSLVYIGVLSPEYSNDQELNEWVQNLQSLPVLETLQIMDSSDPDAEDFRCQWALWISGMRQSACKNLREIVIEYSYFNKDDLDAAECAWVLGEDAQWRQFAMSQSQLNNVWRSKKLEHGRLLRGPLKLGEHELTE